MRALRRDSAFAISTILIVALGVGASTAVFSIADRVLWRPLPYSAPDRLYALGEMDRKAGSEGATISVGCYTALSQRLRSLEEIAAFDFGETETVLQRGGAPRPIESVAVTPNFFRVLGATANGQATRFMSAGQRAVLLGARLAETLGAVSNVVTDRDVYDVIGRGPVAFVFPSFGLVQNPQIFHPLRVSELPDSSRVFAFVLLRNGFGREGAERDATVLCEGSKLGYRVVMAALTDKVVTRSRLSALLLLLSVAMIVMIALATASHLVMATAASRRGEFCTRIALGGSIRTIFWLLLREHALLIVVGTAFGLLSAQATLKLALPHLPTLLLRGGVPSLDQRVIAFAVILALTMGFGLTTLAVMVGCRRWNEEMRRAGSTVTLGRTRSHSLWLAFGICSGVVPAILGLLFIGSARQILTRERGMNLGAFVLTPSFSPPTDQDLEMRNRLVAGLAQQLRMLPHVTAIGLVDIRPFMGATSQASVSRDGDVGIETRFELRRVKGSYFAALGVSPYVGQVFADDEDRTPKAVVSTTVAKRLFGTDRIVGKTIRVDGDTKIVVAVVRDLDESASGLRSGVVFVPADVATPLRTIVAATDGVDWPLVAAAREASDGRVLSVRVARLREDVQTMGAATEFYASILGATAVVTTTLAALAVFATTRFALVRSRRDIAVRLAFGATQQHVRWRVARVVVFPCLVGSLLGACVAAMVARLAATLLVDLPAGISIVLVAGVLGVSLLATGLAWVVAGGIRDMRITDLLRDI